MRFNISDFAGTAKKIRSNDIYDVYDLKAMKNLLVSMTHLHPGKATTGNSHGKEEEVYVFLEGSGEMQLGGETFPVAEGDVVLVDAGKFHRVFNTGGSNDMKFFCVFEKYDGRGV